MASKSIEDAHVNSLNKLLDDAGLECVRVVAHSTESESEEGVTEEVGTVEEEVETVPEEVTVVEQQSLKEEELHEEQPAIFPSPSLRRIVPDKIRKIEDQNRIRVIPETFKTDIDPDLIPRIAHTAQQKYIDILAEMLGCKDYKSSLAEFWFLDTLANLLRRAQEEDLDRTTQAMLILWFCEWMKEMQHFDAADRQRMLKRFQDNMLVAAKYVAEEDHLPTPAQAGVFYKAVEDAVKYRTNPDTKNTVTFEGMEYKCSLRDLTKITHYIYDLFSTDYQYNLVRSVFTFTPEYIRIHASYQMQNPKRFYVPLKPKTKKEKSPKRDATKAGKGKKKEPDTAEFITLMELKAKEERQLEEQEEQDREDYNRRSHVLPLALAATEELFNKYWPLPLPDPEPEPEPEVKAKGKKGKK